MNKQLKYLPNSFTIKFFENDNKINKTILQPSILQRQILRQNKSESRIYFKNLNREKENYSKLKNTKEEKINLLMNSRKKIINSYLYYKNKYKNNPNYEIKNIPQNLINKNANKYDGISFIPKYYYNNSQEKKSTIISQIKREKIQEIKNKTIPKNQNVSIISEEKNIPEIKEEAPQNISTNEKEQIYPQNIIINEKEQICPQKIIINEKEQICPQNIIINEKTQVYPHNILIKKNSNNSSKRRDKKLSKQKKAVFNRNIAVENISKINNKHITKSESSKNQLSNKIQIFTKNKNSTNNIVNKQKNNCVKNFKQVIIINSDKDEQKNNFSNFNSANRTQNNSFYEEPKYKFILQNNYLTLEKNNLYNSDENNNVIYIDLREKQISKPINNSNYLEKYNKIFKQNKQNNPRLNSNIKDKTNDANNTIKNKKNNENQDGKKHKDSSIKEENMQEGKQFTFKEEYKVNIMNENSIEGKRKNDLNKLLLFANKFNI